MRPGEDKTKMGREYPQEQKTGSSPTGGGYPPNPPPPTHNKTANSASTAPPPAPAPRLPTHSHHYYPYGPGGHPHPPPPSYEAPPHHPMTSTTENGHRGAPGPYTAAQYESSKVPPPRSTGGLPLYHHASHGHPPSNSSPSLGAHSRDPPPPLPHYPPPMHGHSQDHARPSPPPGYPPHSYREEHRAPPHWPGHPDPAYAAGHPAPRYYESAQPPPSYSNQPPQPPPPPSQSYPSQPQSSLDRSHPGPYRFSDHTLRRQAESTRPHPGPSERYNEVDGREGATSPSQIESSHREEVTTMGCTCKKTKCLKLYCQCFAVKIYCGINCRCLICRNTVKFEKDRKDAIRNILSRNPSAFDTKFKKTGPGAVAVARVEEDSPTVATDKILAHKLGCKCRKSACMKKYCECYAGSVKCSANCRCVGCKNMPPGGLGPPGTGPMGVLSNRDAASMSSSEDDTMDQEPVAKPGSREHWMMNAAQNLAFLKHSSPAADRKRQIVASDMGTVASSPSLASENSPVELDQDSVGRTVSAAGASKIPEPTSSEKTAVNALLMAAMAMAEMGTSSSSVQPAVASPRSSDISSLAGRKSPPGGSYCETPPKALDLSEKLRGEQKRQSPLASGIPKTGPTQSAGYGGHGLMLGGRTGSSDTDNRNTAETDDDSPKRDLPDDTPSQHHKVKRSRIGSHRKGPRNLGEEMSSDVKFENKASPYNGYGHTYGSAETMVETTPKAKAGKNEEIITPVSARCIDFRRMNVNEQHATKK